MKKLMIGAFVALAAVATQAAAINWSCTTIVDKDGVTLDQSTQFSTYTAVATFWDATGAEVLKVSNGTFSQMAYVYGMFTGEWGSSDVPAPALNTSYKGQLVITDKDGYTLTSAISPIATTGSPTLAYTFDAFDQTGANHGWQSVPEPTSGLLLLLGVAGLALRRRRA